MAAPRKYNDSQREAILRLVTVEGCSYAKAAELCAQGIYNLEPFQPSKATITDIVRATTQPANGDATELRNTFDDLSRGLMGLVKTEIKRLQDTDGPLDADHALKMAKALGELRPLVKPDPPDKNGNGKDSKPPTLLGTLGNDPTPNGHSSTPSEVRRIYPPRDPAA